MCHRRLSPSMPAAAAPPPTPTAAAPSCRCVCRSPSSRPTINPPLTSKRHILPVATLSYEFSRTEATPKPRVPRHISRRPMGRRAKYAIRPTTVRPRTGGCRWLFVARLTRVPIFKDRPVESRNSLKTSHSARNERFRRAARAVSNRSHDGSVPPRTAPARVSWIRSSRTDASGRRRCPGLGPSRREVN